MDVDEALSKLGKYNRWRVITYCLVCSAITFASCCHMMSIVFIGGEPQHHCKLEDDESLNETIPVLTKGKKIRYSQCTRYINSSLGNSTMPCSSGWEYDRSEFESTIVTEWDLVCDQNFLVDTSQSVFNFGVMVGAVVFSSLADCIGRKPVILGCQYLMLCISLIIVFSPNYITFVVLRFFHGAVREGSGLVGIVYACELFPASQRTFAGTAIELFWVAAWMALVFVAYLVRNWRYLQLAITLPSLLTIALIWLLSESIPWLAANNRTDEAESILRKAATSSQFPKEGTILHRHQEVKTPHQLKIIDTDALPEEKVELAKDGEVLHDRDIPQNDIELSCSEVNHFQSNTACSESRYSPMVIRLCYLKERIGSGFCSCFQSKGADVEHRLETQQTFLDLMKSKKMALYAFIMCSLWFANSVVYFSLSLSTSSMAGDRYVNFCLSGAVEAPAYLLTIVVLQKFGRRWPLFIFHLTAGVVLFANIFIPTETDNGTNLIPLITTLTMIGKFAITASFGTVVLYAPEIYPTNLRNVGFGMASVSGRIGGMISPFIVYIIISGSPPLLTHGPASLAAHTGHPHFAILTVCSSLVAHRIPMVVFASVALVTGVMALFLPETQNRALPDTIEDIESWTHENLPRGNQSKQQLDSNTDDPTNL